MNQDTTALRRLADEQSRLIAAGQPRPEWRAALDELCLANYGNLDFWRHLLSIAPQGSGEDDLNQARAWFAQKCRICGRPMHARRSRCDYCNAQVATPTVITGTVIAGELEP